MGTGIVLLFWLVVLTAISGLYFFPTIVALHRRHPNSAPIGVVNAFFGWTMLGWVFCFAWSLMARRRGGSSY